MEMVGCVFSMGMGHSIDIIYSVRENNWISHCYIAAAIHSSFCCLGIKKRNIWAAIVCIDLRFDGYVVHMVGCALVPQRLRTLANLGLRNICCIVCILYGQVVCYVK